MELPAPPEARVGDFPVAARPMCDARVWAAVNAGDAGAVQKLAQEKVNFSCGDPDEPTPLDWAVMKDRVRVVRALLEGGADPNLRWGQQGDSFPLQRAIEARNYGNFSFHRAEIVSLLIRYGADANARWCPFETRMTDTGVEACAAWRAPTPLMAATWTDQADTVGLLLAAGADVHVKEGDGFTALDLAREEAIYGLLMTHAFDSEAAAVADFKNRHLPPYDVASSGKTILMSAIENQRYGLVRQVLAAGADPNQVSGDRTPLARAVHARWVPGIELLLRANAKVDERACASAAWLKAIYHSPSVGAFIKFCDAHPAAR